MPRHAQPLLSLACLAALAVTSCGGDDPVQAEDPGAQPGHVYIYAGDGRAGYGSVGQVPAKTRLYWPQDVVFAPDGAPVILDWNNHRVIGLDDSGRFELIVGVADGDFGDPCPASPAPCVDVVATNAKLNHPTHVAFDQDGNMILAAWHNSDLFHLDMQTGLMDRICGTGQRPCYNGDEQPAVDACVDLPAGVAFDPSGRICFADQANMIIRMIDETGVIHCIAGTPPLYNDTTGEYDIIQFGYSGDEGPAVDAKLSFERGQIADPSGKICFDPFGNLYIADTSNHVVRRVDVNGIIHLFAGHPLTAGYGGDGASATASTAYLNEPRDVASDEDGNIYIADTGNNVIRMVSIGGTLSTVAGVQRPKNPAPLVGDQVLAENGLAANAVHLTSPSGVEVDSRGRVWIADQKNNVIRILYR